MSCRYATLTYMHLHLKINARVFKNTGICDNENCMLLLLNSSLKTKVV